jgi:RNA polymerase sigma-70 factor (ECF subfamily)
MNGFDAPIFPAITDGVDDAPGTEPDAVALTGAVRVTAIVRAHYAFLWRSLRRLGLAEHAAEDAAQQVLCVVARRINEIGAGKEKAFLFGAAMRVAQTSRRESAKLAALPGDELLANVASADPGPAELLDVQRSRALLDTLLESMPFDLRTVFVLYEVEEMSMAEIALALDLRPGTVASRLRRARETFAQLCARVRMRSVHGCNGGNR